MRIVCFITILSFFNINQLFPQSGDLDHLIGIFGGKTIQFPSLNKVNSSGAIFENLPAKNNFGGWEFGLTYGKRIGYSGYIMAGLGFIFNSDEADGIFNDDRQFGPKSRFFIPIKFRKILSSGVIGSSRETAPQGLAVGIGGYYAFNNKVKTINNENLINANNSNFGILIEIGYEDNFGDTFIELRRDFNAYAPSILNSESGKKLAITTVSIKITIDKDF